MGVFHSTLDNSEFYKQLKADIAALDNNYVKAGFPEGAKVGDAKKKSHGKAYEDMSEVARIATWNEFGAKIQHAGGTAYRSMAIGGKIITRFIKNSSANSYDNRTGAHTIIIPARPFFRKAIDTCKEQYSEFQGKIVQQVLDAKITPPKAFELLGLWIKAKIQKSIRDTTTPPNSDATIRRKGSSHPLIDTAQMLNSVTHVTVSGKAEGQMKVEVR